MSDIKKESDPGEDPIREHSFDGIQEYDKRLPNWWLWTLWLSVVFAFFYWAWAHIWEIRPTQDEKFQMAYDATFPEEAKARADAEAARVLSDEELWGMSQDAVLVAEGSKVFQSTCASCHGADMRGGIGVNLLDQEWKHGGNPGSILHTVTNGVLAKGMPAWGPQLGKKRVSAVVAFVLSKHNEGEAGMESPQTEIAPTTVEPAANPEQPAAP